MKGSSPGKHLVKNCAKGKNIRTLIYGPTLQLFGGHVPNSSHYHTGICIHASSRNIRLNLISIKLSQLCQTKVENLHATVIRDEDVVGFEIAMDDSLLVCCGETVGYLQCVIDCPPLAQRTTTDSFAQRLSFE